VIAALPTMQIKPGAQSQLSANLGCCTLPF